MMKANLIKKIAPILLLLILSALTAITLSGQTGDDTRELQTVTSVDLKRYAGVWYEIARYPNKFQKKCVGNTTAEYRLQDDGDITVINKCKETDGEFDTAKGEARIADKATSAKLEVRFAPKFLSFLPFVWGDYWIIDLGENYEYVAVGSPDRKYLWILSRTPQMSDSVYQNVLQTVREKGFEPNNLVKTPQS